jgi:hypothetical protein
VILIHTFSLQDIHVNLNIELSIVHFGILHQGRNLGVGEPCAEGGLGETGCQFRFNVILIGNVPTEILQVTLGKGSLLLNMNTYSWQNGVKGN